MAEQLTAAEIQQVQGFFGNIKDGIGFLKSPLFKDLMALIAAFQTPDKTDDKAAIKKLLEDINQPQLAALVEPIFDFIMAMLDAFGSAKEIIDTGPIKVGAPSVLAEVEIKTGIRKAIKDMTVEECQKWFDEHKGAVRTASKSFLAKRVLSKRCPEVLGALDGTATRAQLTALTPEQIIKGLNIAILVLTAASAFYPPLGLLVTVLKIVLARYESSHPDVGLALSDLL